MNLAREVHLLDPANHLRHWGPGRMVAAFADHTGLVEMAVSRPVEIDFVVDTPGWEVS
jgi:hypothetical protein